MRQWLGVIVAACFALVMSPAYALDPERTLQQLNHTAWTAREGAPSKVMALAQTVDGYLWLGSPTGLFRFDGVKFERFQSADGSRLQSNSVFSLLALASGALWVGYPTGGISLIEDGHVTNYGEKDGLPLATITGLAQDGDGTLWASTASGLTRFVGGRWEMIGAEWRYPPGGDSMSILCDRQGAVWVATSKGGVYRLAAHAKAFELVDRPNLMFAQLAQAPDGKVWVSDPVKKRGTMPLPLGHTPDWQDRWWPADLRMFAPAFDREAGLWFGVVNGLQRLVWPAADGSDRSLREPTIQTFSADEGLSGSFVISIIEDREGSIWVGTSGGLDRFRSNKATLMDFGRKPSRIAIAPGNDSSIWAGVWYEGLKKVTPQIESIAGMTPQISALFNDRKGTLWVGGLKGLWKSSADGFQAIALPPGQEVWGREVQALATNGDDGLWVSVGGSDVLRLRDGIWTPKGGLALPGGTPVAMNVDTRGRVWMGYRRNLVAMVDGDKVSTFGVADGMLLGSMAVFGMHRDHVWAGGEFGLAVLDGKRFRQLSATDANALEGISGIIETAQGDLWLNAGTGILHITASEVTQALADPSHAMRFERLDALDGVPGIAEQMRPVPTAVESSDGKLWFSLSNGVVTVDPAHMRRNLLPPNVLLQSLSAGGQAYPIGSSIELPAGSSALQISYAATSLAIPERLRFRYRMEGVDNAWQEAGNSRSAQYTNLGPGHYRFQVIAANDEGVWNETGASMTLTIAPAFYQTVWFKLICAAALLCLAWLAYRLRMQHVAGRVADRFLATMSERERIARELHDTFLQGVQGLLYRFQLVADRIPQSEGARQLMEETLVGADHVMSEGRDRVRDLRSAALVVDDLGRSLAELAAKLGTEHATLFEIVSEGDLPDCVPEVIEESYRIAREALFNAYQHAGATRITVTIVYARHQLTLRIEDDGCGVPEDVLLQGWRTGHWGMAGMRERAATIGATLTISRRMPSGTRIELDVPASRAYRPVKRLASLLKVAFGRGEVARVE